MTGQPGLLIEQLEAAHGRSRVLTGLDLTVEDGALACVLGPSGCGKSTLLRIVAGFHPAARGRVTLRGRLLDDGRARVPAERRRIGYVPQDGALFPHLTVAANIGFGLLRAGRRERVGEMLDLVGLDGLADRHPHQLSGGQQQRVALARALAPRPQLLLLDEPFAALDAALRTELRTEVAATLRRAGATAILVTHDVDEALAFADAIAVMRDGRIVQADTPHTLYHRPADVSVARSLGEANLLHAKPADGYAVTAFGPLPLTTDTEQDGVVMLRPHQLRMTCEPGPHSVPARVTACLFRGHDHRVEFSPDPGRDLPERLVVYTDAPPPAVGSEVHLRAQGPAHPLHTEEHPAEAEAVAS
ncbi:ABC transporter ATP-binding protein [Streptomyces sp. IMTB 2501]|uniref:ABC transporter ATP-binding protein n=1 Tax=Streptomyces sp. IMTB 2501 TaxID=1776340 RepID=UPI00096EBB54|nr:ABC transporter ATP-binding protein [Streptomyces sp. IMTB 2501]OLZ65392.1 ABC transporter ATP-binding protein [Streptomyces sp. IMTB 2501]